MPTRAGLMQLNYPPRPMCPPPGPRRRRRKLDDLAWWSGALEKARAEGELVPGSFRLRAALAALSS